MTHKQKAALQTAKLIGFLLLISITTNLLLRSEFGDYALMAFLAAGAAYLTWVIYDIQLLRIKAEERLKEWDIK
jgi:hypothetical protein